MTVLKLKIFSNLILPNFGDAYKSTIFIIKLAKFHYFLLGHPLIKMLAANVKGLAMAGILLFVSPVAGTG